MTRNYLHYLILAFLFLIQSMEKDLQPFVFQLFTAAY